MPRYTFPKAEHLVLRNDIDALFSQPSASTSVYPIRGIFRYVEGVGDVRVKVLISVSKRHFRHAVDRNRIKRLMRDVYRHQKHTLIDALPPHTGLHVGFLWMSDKMPSHQRVEQSLQTLINIFADKITLENRPKPAEL